MTHIHGTDLTGGADAGRRDAGFTLVELLVVLAIIGLVAGIAAPQVLRYLGTAKVNATQTQMANIASALDLYFLDAGAYPPQDAGLAALVTAPSGVSGWNGPYLKPGAALLDGWGKAYAYSASADQGVSVLSYGRDGKPQGEGLDADLVHKVQ
ncbi:MAG: type II secretion system major pseudopilin GspG [Rhizobiaceae bacterium]